MAAHLSQAAGRQRGQRHGDARNALLIAAAALLETTGAAGLSLRQVAERAGLSRQAPYNHFAGKEALLAELARDGFDRLAAAVRSRADGRTGEEALAAAGEAYVAFARMSPAQFRLMFSRELVDLGKFPEAVSSGAGAFGSLRAVVATFAAPERVESLSLAAWCMIHGYATLMLEGGLGEHDTFEGSAGALASIIVAGAGDDVDRRTTAKRQIVHIDPE